MANCKKCGSKLEEGANFCPKCGTRTTDETPSISDDEKYIDIANKQGKLVAIKQYKEDKNCDLKEARDHIDDLLNDKVSKLEEGEKFSPKCGTQTSQEIPKESNVAIDQNNSSGRNKGKIGCWTWFFIILFIGYIGNKCSSDNESSENDAKTEQTSAPSSEDKDKAKQEEARIKSLRDNFVGTYYYHYDGGAGLFDVYFTIVLKSDGTFTHNPSNDDTKQWMQSNIVLDNKSYPSDGTWKVEETSAGNAAVLDFGDDWGDGVISPDKKVLEISNMNGYNLKTQLTR